MEAGTIVKWLKSEGDRVERGEPLYEIDTEKATQEVEAEASGVLLKIAVAEGEVPVGQTVALIGEEGEEVSEPATSGARPPREEKQEPSASEEKRAEPAAPASDDDGVRARNGSETNVPQERVKASPLARRMARERGIELSRLEGTGPDGRVVAEDVERAQAAPATAPAA